MSGKRYIRKFCLNEICDIIGVDIPEKYASIGNEVFSNLSYSDKYECQLESESCARLILSHLCSFESEPPKHRSLNDPVCRSLHSYQGYMI